MLNSPSDYLLRGALLGLLLEAVIAAPATLAARSITSHVTRLSLATWLIAALRLGLIVLLAHPVAQLTFRKAKRSPFLLEEDVRAMIVGRTLGTLLGLGFGVTAAITLA
ncbi:hypothetical protein AB4Y45_34520 [Paraburkholderia sp. EG287A]|uniref:hypothetical protein n=1 Tax=Paraburkholderia sp. EG287A TaxID=3237012 RepID=UPI0034D3625D